MRVFERFAGAMRMIVLVLNTGHVFKSLHLVRDQVHEREDQDPYDIDEVPVQAGNLDQ